MKKWDIDEFEPVDGWNYCKFNKTKPMVHTDFSNGEQTNHKGFRFQFFDMDMNPVIVECWYNNTVGKVKASGAKAMLKIYMRRDRNGRD
tara:strand:- start:430 stop:696 length:267 start_codon:yes stop_codon:yes gene_type:complete